MKLPPTRRSDLPHSFSPLVTAVLSSLFASALASTLPGHAASLSVLSLPIHANLTSPHSPQTTSSVSPSPPSTSTTGLLLTPIHSPSTSSIWPPGPFAIRLQPSTSRKFCMLCFDSVTDEDATFTSTEALLWEVLDQVDRYKALPKGVPAAGFDVVREGVRFILEIVPRQLVYGEPLEAGVVVEALDQLYELVLEGGPREVRALIECDGIALGRVRVWFD